MSRNLGTENFHSVPFAGNTFYAPLVWKKLIFFNANMSYLSTVTRTFGQELRAHAQFSSNLLSELWSIGVPFFVKKNISIMCPPTVTPFNAPLV